MARENEIQELMEALQIATDVIVGDVMAARGYWTAGQSARVQAGKALKNLTEEGKLERGDGFFRLPECRSEWGLHAQTLTRVLAEIIKRYEAIIFREHSLPIGLRSDAICLLIQNNQACCLVIEVANHETENSIQRKRNILSGWGDATRNLSELFGYHIPTYRFIVITKGEDICQWLQLLESSYSERPCSPPTSSESKWNGGSTKTRNLRPLNSRFQPRFPIISGRKK